MLLIEMLTHVSKSLAVEWEHALLEEKNARVSHVGVGIQVCVCVCVCVCVYIYICVYV